MTAQMDKPVFAAPAFSETSEEKARRLLRSASKAADQLEADVCALVAMRAWDVLGYADFSEMWGRENGFECPTFVQVLAVDAFRHEGMNTRHGGKVRDGHTEAEVAYAVGLPVDTTTRTGTVQSPTTNRIIKQLDHGVPPASVVKGKATHGGFVQHVNEHGTIPYAPRKRGQPRRLGKAPDEMVAEGFTLARRDADEVAKIARQADVPKAEIYRQAVAEYLSRYRESRPTTVKR